MRTMIALSAVCMALALPMRPATSLAAGAQRAGGVKTCIATSTSTGRRLSWRCQASQKCCFAPLFNAGTCVPAGGICL